MNYNGIKNKCIVSKILKKSIMLLVCTLQVEAFHTSSWNIYQLSFLQSPMCSSTPIFGSIQIVHVAIYLARRQQLNHEAKGYTVLD